MKRTYIQYIFVTILIVSAIFSSCNKYKTIDDEGLCYKKTRKEDPSLTGIVRDSVNEGDFLKDVDITISGHQQFKAKTTQAGVYFFDELRAGTYEVSVNKVGFASERLKVQLKDDECMEIVDIKLKPLYSLIVDKFLLEFDVPSNNILKTLTLRNPFNDGSDDDYLPLSISADKPWIILAANNIPIGKNGKVPFKVSINSNLLPSGNSSGLITINTLDKGSVFVTVTVKK
jgi:Carboxypeptidase regulatory-like domain